MSPALKDLLFSIRQHAGFQDFLNAVDAPTLPRFKRGLTLEDMGAKTVFASGQIDQHDKWLHLLTGQVSPQGESQPSQQE